MTLAALLAACGGSGGSVTPPVLPSPSSAPQSSISSIDAVVQQYYSGGWGVELAIYRNGKLLYGHGYGLRDRGLPDLFMPPNFWRIPEPDQRFHLPRGQFTPDSNTEYEIASVSKEFTAGAILLLQQDGKLSVNDPLSKYFPSLQSADAIPRSA